MCVLVDSKPSAGSWAASLSLEVQSGSGEADERQSCPYWDSISSPSSLIPALPRPHQYQETHEQGPGDMPGRKQAVLEG